MSIPASLSSSPLFDALGWALVHSVWQGAAVLVLLRIALALLRGRSPNARYLAATSALGLMLALPAVTFVIGAMGTSPPAVATAAPVQATNAMDAMDPSDAPAPPAFDAPVETLPPAATGMTASSAMPPDAPAPVLSRAALALESRLPWLTAAWCVGVLAVGLWHLGGWFAAQRLRSVGVTPAPDTMQTAARRLADRLGVTRPVQLLQSALVRTPIVFGWLRPVVLLPAAVVSGLSAAQLEAILAHELAHVRRHDYLVNLLQCVAETLLFYHPAAWWVSAAIREEREHCCDDAVLALGVEPLTYAQSLVHVLESAGKPGSVTVPAVALAASGRPCKLRRRLMRMLPGEAGERPGGTGRWAGALAAVFLVALAAFLRLSAAADSAAANRAHERPAPARQAQRLERAAEVHVDILTVDPAGKPMAGVEVYGIENLYVKEGRAEPLRTLLGPVRSGPDGLARLAGFPARPAEAGWSLGLYARVPGKKVGAGRRAFWKGSDDEPPTGPVRVVMGDAGPLRGRVDVPPGHKPGAARVWINDIVVRGGGSGPNDETYLFAHSYDFHKHLPGIFSVPVAADGTFTLPDQPVLGVLYHSAAGPGLGEERDMLQDPGKAREPLTVRLRPQAVIEGSLTYRPEGEPAAGVELRLHPDTARSYQGAYTARTAGDGTFRFDGLAEGVYSLVRRAGDQDDGWTMPVRGRLRAGVGETMKVDDLALERGGVFTGRVIDNDTGKPVEGASASAIYPAGARGHEQHSIGSARSGADGGFTLRLPAGDSHVYLNNPGKGYVSPEGQDGRNITVSPDGEVTGDATFPVLPDRRSPETWAVVRGRVVDPAGKPLAGLKIGDSRVEMWGNTEMPVSDSAAAETDADGRFELRVQAAIPHQLFIGSPEYGGITETFDPEADATIDIEITARPRPVIAEVTGVVTDAEGKPLADVEVGLDRPDDGRTDAAGRFRLQVRNADKTVAVAVRKGGYGARRWHVPAGGRDLRFVLHPGTRNNWISGDEPLPDPAGLAGKPAPALDVESWVRPAGGAAAPKLPPDDAGGRRMLLAFTSVAGCGPDELAARLRRTIAEAERLGARAVFVFDADSHPAAVEAAVAAAGDLPADAAVAVDRFVPDSPYEPNSATQIAYGRRRAERAVLIGADGTVTDPNYKLPKVAVPAPAAGAKEAKEERAEMGGVAAGRTAREAEQMKLRLAQAERELQRIEQLKKNGAGSLSELEAAKIARDMAAAELNNDPAEVARLKLRRAELELARQEKLRKNGAGSLFEFEAARIARDMAAAELNNEGPDDSWPPLLAGMFKGSATHATDLLTRLNKTVMETNW